MAQQTPDQELARKIADKLIEAKLLDKEERKDFEENFAGGKLKGTDWKQRYELRLQKAKQGVKP